MINRNMTIIADGEIGISRYINEIKNFPLLEKQEEYMLAKRYIEHSDLNAVHKLVTSHLRLVVKIAMGYRGYGMPISEVISEGNVGLMQAVKKFDPERGFRLATYSIWWIKAAIQEYILRTWSLVKIGTTANQKRLFFNLRRLKKHLQAVNDKILKPEQITAIANKLNVSESEVISMNCRLSGDQSLNTLINSSEEDSIKWQEWLVDEHDSQEQTLIANEESINRKNMLISSMSVLNPRERKIFEARRLRDNPVTLENLSSEFEVSRERIRQIEARAFEKVQSEIKKQKDQASQFPN
ncbi:RNA polymerase sigma factor RpoH [Candidatus Liberibacter americanus]|uniref:RNA polymerase sigma factor n=1 Tax=Candidatus Liberibacter americanus str. Sao Paulo TaxID=1261131 RepID=U6B6F5_9HYPH|nr:RNA polymerase sigma factor RpoH [Candidatus Liberibacter americanus]AHA28359.1 DNA-directed RNA polymerase sigma subunit [Candidatus Liberibacter americanus str. Sao Paulo]EMS36648.1 RNA polymerase factor sigma-32 [Candidatus Liberibacter americanus PW_SP]